jgi:curved DNA-binding protein CbpA
MTTEEAAQNHYQVLGLERGADERAVKKAYFALVRKTPPDTHPEEFKRLREAYEVLTDPVARKRFDDAERDFREYGDDAAVTLREAEAAIKAGDEAAAQEKLRALCDAQPELKVARENLAGSLSRTGAFPAALEQIDALIEQAPDEARYHFLRGMVLRGMEEPKKAKSALRKAHKLAPEDLGIHLALADELAHAESFAEALSELTEAAGRQTPGSAAALRVALRRITILFVAKDPAGGDEAITDLFAEVRASDDAELARHVSAQLAAVAAGCFARKAPEHGNAVLRRCEELHPDSLADHPFPAKTELDFAALPAPAQEWLAKLKPGGPTVRRHVAGTPVFAFLATVAFFVLFVGISFDDATAWGTAGILGTGVVSALGAAALAMSVRRTLRMLQSPVRGLLTLHPLYLIEASIDRVFLYPVVRLDNVQATHHHTNGMYTHTAVNISFGPHLVAVSLRGKDYAEGWVGALLGRRRRVLELMLEGFLEAEQGVDLIPPALLTHPPEVPVRAPLGTPRQWYAAAAVAAAVLWGIIVFTHARAVDDTAYSTAVRADTIESYRAYLSASPAGRHADGARREIARAQARVEDALRAVTDPRAPGAAALLRAVHEQTAAGATSAPLVLDGIARDEGAGALADRLNAVLSAAGLPDVMTLKPTAGAAPVTGTPVALLVSARSEPDPQGRQGTRFVAHLLIAGSETPAYTFETVESGDARVESLAWKLCADLGLDGLAGGVRHRLPQSTRPSPYRAEGH